MKATVVATTLNHRIKLDTELLEYVCLENEKSRARYVGKQ
jgi:hypothetical protein